MLVYASSPPLLTLPLPSSSSPSRGSSPFLSPSPNLPSLPLALLQRVDSTPPLAQLAQRTSVAFFHTNQSLSFHLRAGEPRRHRLTVRVASASRFRLGCIPNAKQLLQTVDCPNPGPDRPQPQVATDMWASSPARPPYTELPGGGVAQGERKIPKTMLAKLGQRFNSAGIAFTLKVIFKEPQLALPHRSVPDITSIDWAALKHCGFQGIVFDKDNTLTAPYVQSLWPSLASSLEDCKKAFDGRIALLSNSAGLYQYDPDGSEAKAVEDMLGIPVIRHGSKKPAGSAEDVKKHFGCDPSMLVMVGDRHFTDIVYGNRNGFLTIYTKPLTLAGEPLIVRLVRKLEGMLIQRWFRKGLMPTNHGLFSSKYQFIKESTNW